MEKASKGIRSIIEEAMRKSVENKTLTQKQMDKVVRNLDLIDAGKKPVNKKDGGMIRGAGAAIRGTKFKGVF